MLCDILQDNFRGVPETKTTDQLGGYRKTNDAAVARLQTHLNGHSKSESSPDYYQTLCYLNNDWRVALCKDQIQWLLQKKRGSDKWESRLFCRTKAGLLRATTDSLLDIARWGEIDPGALKRINNLPTMI